MIRKTSDKNEVNFDLVQSEDGQTELVAMDKAIAWLEQAGLEETKEFRDKAEAVRQYAARAGKGLKLQNQAAELKLRAERKAGELLKQFKLRGGDRKSKGHRDPLILDGLGISRNDSKRWQKEASLPEDVFEDYLATTYSDGTEISSAAVRRLAERQPSSNGHKAGGIRSKRPSGNGKVPPVASAGQYPPPVETGRFLSGDVFHELETLVPELVGHYTALKRICGRVLNEEETSFTSIEHRTATRYLREMEELLSRLEELLI